MLSTLAPEYLADLDSSARPHIEHQFAPWEANPYRLINWWKMEKFSAVEFFEIAKMLTAMQERCKGKIPDEEIIPWITEHWLPGIEAKCRQIGLVVSVDLIARYNRHLSLRLPEALSGFATNLEHINDSIEIEMSKANFMYVAPERACFYDQKELFGVAVNAKFPSIQFDMVESGNCYATGRGTASVFHLMRIMETGVQQFGAKLGVSLVGEKNWQNILDEINKAIKVFPKSPAIVEMSEASANLYAVKLAWRNEVMHPKDTYTLEEADNLIRQVRIFMQQLAKII